MKNNPANTDDVIDSRDVIERISELEIDLDGQDVDALVDESDKNDDDTTQEQYDAIEAAEELVILRTVAEEADQYAPDWQHGEALIRESYFVEYAKQLAEDIGAIGETAWPACHIDWDAAAASLKQDYTEIDYDGVTYLIRM